MLHNSINPLALAGVEGGDSIVRITSVLTSVAATLVLLAPVHAVAQEAQRNESVRQRPRPDYDAQGRQIGAFTLNASLGAYVTSNDNVFATETNAQDDIVYGLSPNASLSSDWSRHALAFTAGADFNRYSDFGNEDTESSYLGAYGRLDIGDDTNASANLRTSMETESRTAPDASSVVDPIEFTRNDASIGAEHTINRFRLSGSVGSSDVDYDDVTQNFRDRTEDYVTARVAVAVSPRIALLADARWDEREYDNAPGLNSEGRVYAAGVRLNLTGQLSGEVTVGHFEREYDVGPDVDGAAFAANVSWYVTPLTTISVRGARNVEETGAATAATYINTDMGVRVDHELRRNIILSGGIAQVNREYETIDREDDATIIDVGAEYLVNRRFSVEARFDRIDSSSDGIDRDRDFDQNRFTVGARVRL